MIEPTPEDIGREATYYEGRHWPTVPLGFDPPHEDGVITACNDAYVFVRYGADKHSKATKRENLYWSHPRIPINAKLR